MRRSILSSAAAVCLALGASYAQADTVRIDTFTYAPAVAATVGSPSFTGEIGKFTGVLNGDSFTTFCTDIAQSFNFGQTYTDYSVVEGVTAWGATKSAALDQLFTYFAASGLPTDATSSAVAQAAVWEILYETSGTYDLTSGTFQASSASVPTGFSTFDWATVSTTVATVHANQLYSQSSQDFVVLTPVPEPSTYALMLAGLAGIGFVARRRAQR